MSTGRKEVKNDGTNEVVTNVGKFKTTIEEINEESTAEAAAEGKECKETDITNDEEKVRRKSGGFYMKLTSHHNII